MRGFGPGAMQPERGWGSAVPSYSGDKAGIGWQLYRAAGSRLEDDPDDPSVISRRTAKMARLEAALLVADGALSTRKLAQFATLADAAETRTLIDRLNAAYDAGHTAFRIERVATGYQLLTRPHLVFWLDKLHHRQAALKLSSPALETLTIVAYHCPITRADVEAVRGVQCSEMLKQLMERGLVRICGEDDSLGRPYLYETTRKFLELFGLRNLDDLPMADRLRQPKTKRDAAAAQAPAEELASEEQDAAEAERDEPLSDAA
jgi:segregation and condensation protein B